MNISEIFIRRPVMTSLLMLGMLIFGIMAFIQLPVSDLPDMELPTIVVSANLSGASPETMASAVATPLEQQFTSIAGLQSMTSSSSLGATQITLQFDFDRDIDGAAQDVQSAISIANKFLPTNLTTPPSYKKVNPSSAPVIYIALNSEQLPLYELNKYAEDELSERISMINGVAQVNVYGSQKYAVRLRMDPNQLATRGISLTDISNAVNSANSNQATGSLNGIKQALPIQADGQLKSAAVYMPLIVAYRNGAPVRLQDLGQVVDSVENDQVASWFNHKRGIVLAVQRQPGSNTLEVINSIKELLPAFEKTLPASVKVDIIYDRSPSIRAAVHEVEKALILASILVVLVIFIFLRNPSATLIPSFAMPLSIIGTFAVMNLAKFNLDTISLMALTLTVGFVVDDAIVMLENIIRHLEMGKSPVQAALDGSKEIGFTILSMTLSLTAVFIPILFMGGILGKLFHEFAVTTCASILLSGLISITLTPMLSSRFLKAHSPFAEKPFFKRTEAIFEQMLNLYRATLDWSLKHSKIVGWAFGASLLLSCILFVAIPKGFMPDQDIDQLIAFTESDPSVSFQAMSERQKAAGAIIRQDPDVISIMSVVGAGGVSSNMNAGRIFVRLKPKAERDRNADKIMQDLRPKLKNIPGLKVYIQNIPAIPMGKLSKSTYQFTLQSTDLNELRRWTDVYQQRMAKLPILQDVTNDLQSITPQVSVKVDRDKASALGVNMADIQNTLGFAFGGQQISNIYTSSDTYEVILELEPKYQLDMRALSLLYVDSSNGNLVPLDAIATIGLNSTPLTINHNGQMPSATISFNLKPGAALGDAVAAINKITDEIHPPVSLSTSFTGTADAFKSSQQGMGLLLILAIFIIYLILGILYESFIHPLTILSGLPAAAVGALLSLMLTGNDLNIYGFIGMIMLVGIVKKNAIMMIDFAIDAQRKNKMAPEEAIHKACLIRFRPIMMTTMAALLGTLPLAIASGTGSEILRPLGISVVGGLLLSQLLTLYITPVIYLFFEKRLQKRFSFSDISEETAPPTTH